MTKVGCLSAAVAASARRVSAPQAGESECMRDGRHSDSA